MRLYWIWLAHHPKLNNVEKGRLAEYFQDAESLYFSSPDRDPLPEELAEPAARAVADRSLEEAERTLESCAREGLSILTWADEQYPRRLKAIADPPLVLYYKGKLPALDAMPAVGVVGTRKASAYGLSMARKLGYQLGKCGAAVVSGMALGVDARAMEGALAAKAPVVGVLGCGAEQVYPKQNRELFADTERFGCIVSEYPPGTPPNKWNFPQRNRIISGLCNGILVVEAPDHSGSLITARRAAEQGRDVFVVPGNVDLPGFAGSYRLLREGATPASCGYDVVCEYERLYPGCVIRDDSAVPEPEEGEKQGYLPEKTGIAGPSDRKKGIDKQSPPPYSDQERPKAKLTPDEERIVDTLMDGERLADDVIAETGLSTGKMLALMTVLELKGIIKRLPGKRLILNK